WLRGVSGSGTCSQTFGSRGTSTSGGRPGSSSDSFGPTGAPPSPSLGSGAVSEDDSELVPELSCDSSSGSDVSCVSLLDSTTVLLSCSLFFSSSCSILPCHEPSPFTDIGSVMTVGHLDKPDIRD